MGWFEDVTGKSGSTYDGTDNWNEDAYRWNKSAMDGRTITEGSLNEAAYVGALGRDASGRVVGNADAWDRYEALTSQGLGGLVSKSRGGFAGNGAGATAVRTGSQPVGGPGVPQVATVPGTVPTTGPAQVAAPAPGVGPASWPTDPELDRVPEKSKRDPKTGLIITQPPSRMPGREFPLGPLPLEANPYWPPAQAIEDEIGEAEFMSPGWFATWGKALSDIEWNIQRAVGGTPYEVGQRARQEINRMVEEGKARVTAPIPSQEPVDWGL